MRQWEIVPAQARFAEFASDWDKLNHRLFAGHPFFDSRFVGPLLQFFGQGSEQLCIHRTSDAVDGALILRPLALGRWALFLPDQAQAGAVLLADARLLETLLPALPGYAWSLDLLSVDPMYAPSWTGLRLPRTATVHAVTMAVATEGSFDAYWQKRPRKLASNMRRYRRRTEEQSGNLSLTTLTEPLHIRDALARYGAMEAAGWKGDQGTAVTIDNAQGRFYERTLSGFAATGQAMVMELHIGDQLAASRLFVRTEQMWIALKTTYNEALSALAPGRQLLYEMLQQAFQRLRSGAVEFYTNASRDQAEWATSVRHITHHQVFRNDAVSAAYAMTRMLRDLVTPKVSSPNEDGSTKLEPRNVAEYQTVGELPEEARRLIDSCADHAVDCSAGWFQNLQQTVLAGDPGIRVYVTSFDDRPSAVLPLRLPREGLVKVIASLSNYYTSLFAPAMESGATELDLVPLLQQADRSHGRAHVARFFPMDPDAPAFEALLTAVRTCGWIPFRYFCFGNWFLPVSATWSQYLAERDGMLRSTLRRTRSKFAAAGGSLEVIAGPAGLEDATDAFVRVYASSWKRPEPCPEFIPSLIRWLASRGELRLGIARIGDRPIAAQLWIVRHGKASIFKLAHDESYSALSPGTLLTAHLMQHVMDCDCVTEVDYMIGDDAYKQSWVDHRRERWGIVAYNPRSFVGLALLVLELSGRAIRWLKTPRRKAPRSGADTPGLAGARNHLRHT